MQYFLSEIKVRTYRVLGIVVVVALVASIGYYKVRAQEVESLPEIETVSEPNAEAVVPEPETNKDEPGESSADLSSAAFLPGAGQLPHPSCAGYLIFVAPTSTTYVGGGEYNTQFASSTPFQSFQDLNGDSLPDYVYTYNQMNFSGGTDLSSEYISCVYLHNGSGWTKEYMCRAYTILNVQTGQYSRREYSGDCAG